MKPAMKPVLKPIAKPMSRRHFVKWSAAAVAGTALTQAAQPPTDPKASSSARVTIDPERKQIAMLVYPGMTALDLIAPQMIFALLPGRQLHLVAKTLEPVESDTGVTLQPTLSFADTPEVLEVLFVPGGLAGTGAVMRDRETLEFLAARAVNSRYVTSVCIGSLILGAAGLLEGYKASTHWTARNILPLLGAHYVHARVVEDRNRITAGGVTSGMDFALSLAAKLESADMARALQLAVEYAPAPPFHSGTPEEAGQETVAAVRGSEPFATFIEDWREAARAVR